MAFNHSVKPLPSGRHPKHAHLVLFEIESHYGSYILTTPARPGASALISADDAEHFFGKQFEAQFAYLSDEIVGILDPIEA